MSIVLLGATSGSVTLAEPAVGGSTTINIPAASGTMAVLPAATGVLAEASGGTGTTTGYYGFKNRIINGAMTIDQRNGGALVSGALAGSYVLDRWKFWVNGSGGSAAYTVQQSTISPAGFTNSIAITQTASHSPITTQYNAIAQYIEGYNVADFGWGEAGATAVTLSFWVRSSLTGTFGGAVSNSSQARSYPFTYTISSANTWEYKTITIPGDTTGTWIKNTGAGILLFWQLGVGSTYLGTATGAWQAATYLGATGATQITATNGATFYITGVQLEKGSTATSFDYRDYGRELAMCQRYYYTFGGDSANNVPGNGQAYLTTAFNNLSFSFPVTLRTNPTFTYSALSDWYVQNAAGGGLAPTSLSQISTDASTKTTALRGTVASGLVAGNATGLYGANTNARLNFSAEL